MKRFQAMAQRITAFVLSAGMMASAAAPTVLAAQQAPSAPLGAENSVDGLGNEDVSDDDGTLVYPEWDDEVTADFPDEDLDIEEPEEDLPDEDVSDDPESMIALPMIALQKIDKKQEGLFALAIKAVKLAENKFKEVKDQKVYNIKSENLASCTSAYIAADEAIKLLSGSYTTVLGQTKAQLRARLNKLENRYNEMVKEDGQRICITAAENALNAVESAIEEDEAHPGALDERELATVVGLYKVAEEAIKKVNKDQPKKKGPCQASECGKSRSRPFAGTAGAETCL